MVMDDIQLAEWKQARETVREFDGRLHDLWKFGFSFLTALLTAEAILVPASLSESLGEAYLPNPVKFCVLLVTLLLIGAISLIDRNYQLFIKAIVQRALVLERALNIELSEIISIRHRQACVRWYKVSIYALFAVAVVVLGYAILWPDRLFYGVLGISIALILITVGITIFIDMRYSKKNEPLDWSLSRIQCQQGEDVAIIITNMSRKAWSLAAGTLYDVRALDGAKEYRKLMEKAREIPPEGNYASIWSTKEVPPGIYQVFPRSWEVPLHRMITVVPKVPSGETKSEKS